MSPVNFPDRFSCRRIGILFLALASSTLVTAASSTVDSIAALQKQVQAATPGDTITLKNGRYETSAPIAVACAGAEGRPITIAAESVGGVEIGGTNGFNVTKPAAHVVIVGFKLTHASGKNAIAAGTTRVRFTRNTFQCTGAGPYLSVSGDDAQVDYNEFRDKKTVGNMINVTGAGTQVARNLWIHHNYFHDFTNARENGAETIRFGLSGLSMSTGRGLVEHNLFVRCKGENELISNKSCGNTYRYNTFLDSEGTQLTLRHGNDCLVYGNYFRNTDGLRIFGDRHQVFSNYFEGNSLGINLGNGDGEVADGAKLTCHDRPDHCVVAFNTLIENKTHYQMNGRKDGMGATNTTFANNILVGGGTAVKIEGPNPGAKYVGNLFWRTKDAGNISSDGFTSSDPRLVADTNGIFHLQAGSAAIDSAVGDFPAATHDQDGQPRAGKKDQGADEFSTAPATARILTVQDVGPDAKSSP
ncbi:MAG TPA: polysaccharide lyase 6 family protein [Opitutaceae bacterium]|nr:polysaccharide lyase 6 family protein [Opitutaceae bacterium]